MANHSIICKEARDALVSDIVAANRQLVNAALIECGYANVTILCQLYRKEGCSKFQTPVGFNLTIDALNNALVEEFEGHPGCKVRIFLTRRMSKV